MLKKLIEHLFFKFVILLFNIFEWDTFTFRYLMNRKRSCLSRIELSERYGSNAW